MPGRVILQDFTGVPVVVDLAAMRDAVSNLGIDASMINPIVRKYPEPISDTEPINDTPTNINQVVLFTKLGWIYHFNAIPNNHDSSLTLHWMKKTYEYLYEN